MSESKSRLGPVAGVGRRIQVAGVVIGALVIGVGYGYAKPASSSATSASHSAAQSTTTPVSSASVVCPLVKDNSSTNVSTYTPTTVSVSGDSKETVTQLGGNNSVLNAGKAGTLTTATNLSGGSEAAADVNNPIVATASGADAAGFTMTETMPSGSTGSTHGLASTNCGSPDTDFWFVGLGTDSNTAYSMLNMANVDNQAASVTITMYTASGQLAQSEATSLQGITISPNSQRSELINTLDGQKQGAPYAIHVVVTSGRIGASVLDWDGNGGGRDFIASQKSASTLVFPGIPQSEDSEKVQLSLLSPNGAASVALRWVGKSTITPAVGSFTGDLVQGKVVTVDLSSVPAPGEYAALKVCGSNSAANQCLPVTGNGTAVPIVGELKISQSDGSGQDTAYVSPVQALTGDAVIADNASNAQLTLTNTGTAAAQVKVSETGSGSNPGTASTTISVPAGQTVNAQLSTPKGAGGDFALVVTPQGGAQDVYAARIDGSGSNLSIQTMSTAAETVTIPAVGQDSSGLVPQN